MDTFQLFLAVPLTISSNSVKKVKFQVAINLKLRITTRPFELAAFTGFLKLPLLKVLNFVIGVNGIFSTNINGARC